MVKLESNEYTKAEQLVKSGNELSVAAVINGIMSGEIFVNNIENPTAALIRTNECNLIAGNTDDPAFNSQVSSQLDFWDPLTPDTEEWFSIIPSIHKNKFIKKYKRRHYVLYRDNFSDCSVPLPDGYFLEKVNLSL